MKIESMVVQAMSATSVSQSVTANNIANINTEGFEASRVDFETGLDGKGVRIADIRKTTTPGPTIPSTKPESPGGSMVQKPHYVEGSNTDLAAESVNMLKNQTSYSAGAALIRTNDEMTGTLLNIVA